MEQFTGWSVTRGCRATFLQMTILKSVIQTFIEGLNCAHTYNNNQASILLLAS